MDDEENFGVLYRKRLPTFEDYSEAIKALEAARESLILGDSSGCRVCGDGGHSAIQCHHNPLRMARFYVQAQKLYQCYHCGYIATTDEQAVAHFGNTEREITACIKALAESAPCTKSH